MGKTGRKEADYHVQEFSVTGRASKLWLVGRDHRNLWGGIPTIPIRDGPATGRNGAKSNFWKGSLFLKSIVAYAGRLIESPGDPFIAAFWRRRTGLDRSIRHQD